MISEKLLSDAKFYDKLLGIFVTAEYCDGCDELFEKIQKLPIARRYYLYKVDGIEHIEYLNRITRGYIPTLTVISPKLKILGIIEAFDIKYFEEKLREIVEAYYKGYEGQEIPDFAPDPVTPDKSQIVYNVISQILDGYPADHRMIELYKFISNISEEYKKGEKLIKYLNDEAKFLITGKLDKPTSQKYSNILAFYVEHDLSKVDELLNLVNENGEVFRSIRKENRGLLIDEASVGNALLTQYEKTSDNKYLLIAEKIYNYITKYLNHEKGFRDSPPYDEISKIVYLEPLANSEAAIFFSRYYAITENKEALDNAKKAISCAYAGSTDPKVLARISIALIKMEDLIKTNTKPPYNDLRLEYSPKVECKYYKDGKCLEDIHEVKFLDF
ncbi:hypothetical protein DFR86_08775 [Acidianus sulfidivorans JP7]|uniref:Thioredoxin n=1 Tax=Acidianus sulfidivorans JP7 TaxID=619593 RepID=A0A2U9INN3_9CREN|nr:hypothetical protein [Acidianus sulfidivorans]AWR97630.1 hypothetical protein DFR86_08775 [Acidianus sulfidivorans JP7]